MLTTDYYLIWKWINNGMRLFEFGHDYFRQSIEELLFDNWKHDPFFPIEAETIDAMDDDDLEIFYSAINRIEKLARSHNILDPEEAFYLYSVDMPYARRKIHH